MEQRAICILHQHVACQWQLLLLFVSSELLHAPMREIERGGREVAADEAAAAEDACEGEGAAALCELQRVQ